MQPKDLIKILGVDNEWLKKLRKEKLLNQEDLNPGERTGYSEKGVEHIKKLTVLKKYGLSSAYIKQIEAGEISLQDALESRLKDLEAQMTKAQRNLELVKEFQSYDLEYGTFSSDYYLNEIQRREQNGEVFMDAEDFDFRHEWFEQRIKCPYCGTEQEVDLEDYLCDETCNEERSENGMGPDIVYDFDSDDIYECSSCGKIIRITGWLREYPIGAYDSDEIKVELYQPEEA